MRKKEYLQPLSRCVELHLESTLLKSSTIVITPDESGPADTQKKRSEFWDEDGNYWM